MPLILFHSPSPPLPNASSTLLSNPNSTFYSYVSISSSLKEKPPQNPKLTNSTSTSPHSLEPISFSNGGIKMPTPPWMNGPLVLQPQEVLDLAKPRKMKTRDNNKAEKFDGALTSKLIGRRGKNAVKKIVRSIEKLGETNNLEDMNNDSEQLRIGYCLEQLAQARDSRIGEKMPWERDEEIVFRRMKKERAVSAAELSLEKELLERLRGEAAKMRQWVKVKKAGVTQAVVDNIKLIWMRNELAMVKFDVPLCRNMDRAQEIVEIKTGGLVVWRRKDALVVYRGCDYDLTLKTSQKMYPHVADHQKTTFSHLIPLDLRKRDTISQVKPYLDVKMSDKNAEEEPMPSGIISDDIVNFQPANSSLYERETDRLLDGLGPRFIDWWMHKPLPVDADLLPEVVHEFKPPFRRCPPHTRSKLTDDELTYLRKLAHSLPTHFVLGKNRKLQGLAAAILKLWEKSLIVKIAVKLGVPNTDNEQMAYELKASFRENVHIGFGNMRYVTSKIPLFQIRKTPLMNKLTSCPLRVIIG